MFYALALTYLKYTGPYQFSLFLERYTSLIFLICIEQHKFAYSSNAQLISKCFRAVLNTRKEKFRVIDVKILPNSDLCWNGFTHAQLLNITILAEVCISGIHSSNSFKYLPIAVS